MVTNPGRHFLWPSFFLLDPFGTKMATFFMTPFFCLTLLVPKWWQRRVSFFVALFVPNGDKEVQHFLSPFWYQNSDRERRHFLSPFWYQNGDREGRHFLSPFGTKMATKWGRHNFQRHKGDTENCDSFGERCRHFVANFDQGRLSQTLTPYMFFRRASLVLNVINRWS